MGFRQAEEDSAAASNTASMVVMNVRMVSGMMGEMLRAISEVKTCVQQSQEASVQATAQTDQTSERIGQLGRAVDRIASTAELINKIAQETNMLSLNATIEAARARRAGALPWSRAKSRLCPNRRPRQPKISTGNYVPSARPTANWLRR